MGINWKNWWPLAGLILIPGCVAIPYEAAFSSCDDEAGFCYQECEAFEGSPDYSTCHADCEVEANQCFSGAYDAYRYSGAEYNTSYSPYPRAPWNGRYGSWYPSYGYTYSYDYYSSGRYGRRNNGYRPRRRHQPRNGSQPPASTKPPQSQPPQAKPPRYQPPPATSPPPARKPSKAPRRTHRTKDNPKRDIDTP